MNLDYRITSMLSVKNLDNNNKLEKKLEGNIIKFPGVNQKIERVKNILEIKRNNEIIVINEKKLE